MTAERTTDEFIDRLVITDRDGDVLEASRVLTPDVYAVVILGNGSPVGVTLADGLALLSFLADALGVERHIPPQLNDTAVPCSWCGQPTDLHPVSLAAGGVQCSRWRSPGEVTP